MKQDPEYDEELLDKSVESLILTNSNNKANSQIDNKENSQSPPNTQNTSELSNQTSLERLLKNPMIFAITLLTFASIILLSNFLFFN